jgi:hypothetical protein
LCIRGTSLRVLHLAIAFDYASDDEAFFSGAVEDRLHLLELLGGHDKDHSDAHVEGAHHLGHVNIAELLHVLENRQDGPSAHLDDGAHSLGQNAGKIFRDATAGDVSHGDDGFRFDNAANHGPVALVLLHEFVADFALHLIDVGVGVIAGHVEEELAGE